MKFNHMEYFLPIFLWIIFLVEYLIKSCYIEPAGLQKQKGVKELDGKS